MAHQYPKDICDRFQNFINMVFSLVLADDPSLQAIAIETLGVIGDSAEGKRALENQGMIIRLYMPLLSCNFYIPV